MVRCCSLVIMSVTLLATVGCRSAKYVEAEGDLRKAENDLKAIHLMYMAFESANKRPPEKARDLVPFRDKDPDLFGDAYRRLEQGEYVIYWKTPQDAKSREEYAEDLLGYTVNPTSRGIRAVLMGDGSLRRVEEAVLNELKK